jgi:hypothetical protein
MAAVQPVLQFDVEYPDHLSRWKIFVKGLFAIPHQIILGALNSVVGVTSFIAWFGILFTGRYPRGLFNFAVMYLRWSARVYAYTLLMRDEYPPFGEGDYPARLELDYPERLSRWKIFFKGLFIIPHLVVLIFLAIAMLVVECIAWWAILITGRYPQGMFNFVAGVLRWGYRVTAYWYLLTDAYPPFTMAQVPSPTAAAATFAA